MSTKKKTGPGEKPSLKTRLLVDFVVAQEIHHIARLEKTTVGDVVRRAVEAYVKTSPAWCDVKKTEDVARPTSRPAVQVRTRRVRRSKPSKPARRGRA